MKTVIASASRPNGPEPVPTEAPPNPHETAPKRGGYAADLAADLQRLERQEHEERARNEQDRLARLRQVARFD